jgi:hypothetical protein
MAGACHIAGCKADVPMELVDEGLCPLHYTLQLESRCAELRRETAVMLPHTGKREEVMQFLATAGQRLAKVATGNARLADEMKARILSTFLTLMNLRESMDRAAMRGIPMAPPIGTAKR